MHMRQMTERVEAVVPIRHRAAQPAETLGSKSQAVEIASHGGTHDPQFPWFPDEVLIGTVSSLAFGFTDPDVPPSGTLFYYRITAFTNCGEGP